jgi:hypothetical protein
MASYLGHDIISLGRFRASLSLLLPDSDVDTATAHLDGDPDSTSPEFQRAIRSVQLRLIRQRVRQFVTRRLSGNAPGEDSVSKVRHEVSERALALALHLGLGLPVSQLSEILGRHQYHVARDLLDIRLRLSGRKDHSCKIFLDTLGRYRDGYFDLGLAASIARHRVRCAACHIMLRDFEQIDNQLIGEIQALEREQPTGPTQPRGRIERIVAMAPAAVITAVLIGALVLAAGLVDSLTSGERTPLLASSDIAAPGDAGWIVLGNSEGGLQAFDPETGRRHVLRTVPNGSLIRSGANFLPSPDGEQIAIFAQNPVAGLHWSTRQIDVVSITGEPLSQVEFQHSVDSGWPTGWLNNDEILLITVPVYEGGETAERFLERLEEAGRLRALDVTTGEQRTLYRGGVAQVIPSPDGTRLAMVRPRDPREPGTTVDVWEVREGALGDRLATVDHSFTWTGGLLWSPSSDALYLGYISDYRESDEDGTAPGRDGEFRGEITGIDILRIDRDGSRSVFVESEQGHGANTIGISSETGDIVYRSFSLARLEDSEHEELWIRGADDTRSRQLPLPAGSGSDSLRHQPPRTGVLGYAANYVSQMGQEDFLLVLSGDHYLGSDPDFHDLPHQAFYLTVYDGDLDPSIVSVLSSRRQMFPLRWVSNETLNDVINDSTPSPESLGSPEAIDGARTYVRLDEYSSLSPDGAALIMAEAVRNTGRPFLWYPRASTGRWIAQRTEELSWYSDGHAILGVTEVRRNDRSISRITQHSAGQGGGSSVDAFFDPAGIGDSQDVRYAYPRASTDATRTSFYVVDTNRGRADLWISDWGQGARHVHGTRHSSRIQRLSPLTGLWLDERTFLFTEVLEWSHRLPNQTALNRLTIEQHGETTIEQLLVLEARGRDFGVAIQEYAVSPTGEQIAYRLRHFTDRDDTREGYDSIHLATAEDVRQSLEIQRGDRSRGLVWSPSGHALAVAIDERIGVYFMAGNRFEFATGSGRTASHPAWISDSELWFNVGSGSSTDVRRVQLH